MESIAIENVKQLSNGLGEILHWASVFVKETAAQDITQFTLVVTDVAACASFAEINISKRHRVKM